MNRKWKFNGVVATGSVTHGTPAASSAFTSVSARRTLLRPDPAASQPTPPPEPKPSRGGKTDFPPSLREYVARAFIPENRIDGISQEDISAKLKVVITEALQSDMMAIIDWNTQLLPQQLLQIERAQAAAPTSSFSTGMWPSPHMVQPVVDVNGSSPQKKRKLDEQAATNSMDTTQPPWRKTPNRNVFEDRISYPTQDLADRIDKRQRNGMDVNSKTASKYQADLDRRKQRFNLGDTGSSPTPLWKTSRQESPNAVEGPVIGTCQTLEKSYFRLTAPPKPETVRPLPILEKALDFLKKKWKKENNYAYICDQFKSLRQDLTVQRIKNEFTVNVYEIHARIALEKGDLGEYNQCQTQLRALYKQNLGGHSAEFIAYRILYFIHTGSRTDMNAALADLTAADKQQPAVRHALAVRSALALGNYHKFFRLYMDTPNMGAYLMDMFVVRERLAALAYIGKAYVVSVLLVATSLTFATGISPR